ncbi:MAG TPA: hypothetical protein VMV05_10385 [bacterium]|nr:hypothetical protein [bacterium]
MRLVKKVITKGFVLSLPLGLYLMATLSGCTHGFHLPPTPLLPTATPTFTATITPGCANTSNLNILVNYGGGGGGVTLVLTTPMPTPTPTSTPTSWIASIPNHFGGNFLLQTAADWNNYLVTSDDPTSTLACPFNPTTQALVICTLWIPCNGSVTITSVCNNGSAITVNVDQYAGCCGYPSGYFSCSTQALVVDKFGLPVNLNVIFHPLPAGFMCVWVPWKALFGIT